MHYLKQDSQMFFQLSWAGVELHCTNRGLKKQITCLEFTQLSNDKTRSQSIFFLSEARTPGCVVTYFPVKSSSEAFSTLNVRGKHFIFGISRSLPSKKGHLPSKSFFPSNKRAWCIWAQGYFPCLFRSFHRSLFPPSSITHIWMYTCKLSGHFKVDLLSQPLILQEAKGHSALNYTHQNGCSSSCNP